MITLLLLALAVLSSEPGSVLHPEVLRDDGTEIIYSLDGLDPDGSEQGILLLAQGSGCDPATLPGRFENAELIAPGFARLAIEKYGVTPDNAAQDGSCSEAFYVGDTLQQRVQDAEAVIAALSDQDWWNEDLVLFGGSEGGAVVSMLASRVAEADAVVVFSSGLGFTVEETVMASIPPPVQPMAQQAFADARQNAQTDVFFGGHSHHWWSNALDVRPVNFLLDQDIPVRVVHGTRDASAPIDAARSGVSLLQEVGVCVAYDEREGLDHFMTDAEGNSHRVDVYTDIADWISGVLDGSICS